jgi:chromosome segregation protein
MIVRGPAPARLLALRVQGFKSFAERTNVEFGGGISAVVGPNGSGKSNLADALRWALGEQGRALRSRKAEDVIWAGSEKRAAQGMADVTLVLDNGDGLLPVDFQVLEFGRRLFRSGENEYLLNKQRIRLRDLVDLLDAAHLADNAFLFIGQGMVDQALALRPEERRPLFEEVAGVRRHERRRRKAEEQLVESEANLARVDDILAELRPQARRLAAQAEQQSTRSTVADELLAALLSSTHARWHETVARLRAASAGRASAEAELAAATADLEAAEHGATALGADLAARAEAERDRRETHETARAALTELQLRDGRLAADLDAVERDRRRLADERAASTVEATVQRRSIAAPVPARDLELEAAVAEADRDLAEALSELAGLRSASVARGEELAAFRRAEAARTAEAETARRRLADAERRLADEIAEAEVVIARRDEVATRLASAHESLEAVIDLERRAEDDHGAARQALDAARSEAAAAGARLAELTASAAALRGRLEALTAHLDDEERRPIARAARRLGGRRLDEELVVEPRFRAAIEAALADRVRAYLVGHGQVADLARERGRLVIAERVTDARRVDDATTRRFLDAVAGVGGGRLTDAIRRDATGAVSRLLDRTVWLPDLAACLAVQSNLPPGWVAVPVDGSAVVDDTGVALGDGDRLLDRRAEHARLASELGSLEAQHAEHAAVADRAMSAAEAARARVEAARAEGSRLAADRRRAEELERTAAREAESIAREGAWHAAQRERLEAEVTRLRAAQAEMASVPAVDPAAGLGDDGERAVATWEARAADLRQRRDRLAEQAATHEATRRVAEHARARAEAAAAMAEERVTRADRELAALAEREVRLVQERDALRADLATAVTRERAAGDALAALRAADAADRARLADAERAVAAARDGLRGVGERARAADHAELEARLGLESLRESVLVELAGMGDLGLVALGATPPDHGPDGDAPAADAAPADDARSSESVVDDAGVLESALAVVAERWASEPPPGSPPSPGRLASLRRRFHELGATNPYAVAEYAELSARVASLESQGADLRTAIGTTRELIAELDTLIADQFRTTFSALETAFERRFEQLFGGGFARLSLTDPTDLGSTGVEIVARPPGKKAQALAMLSGGERALTAVALLFAMLEVRPVPFCVLDEVDAALDEANIGRFADALRSLAHGTQFIVITHNRGTIEAADALYGVTVGEDSVSRVISLRLDEAQALASERRPELSVAG